MKVPPKARTQIAAAPVRFEPVGSKPAPPQPYDEPIEVKLPPCALQSCSAPVEGPTAPAVDAAASGENEDCGQADSSHAHSVFLVSAAALRLHQHHRQGLVPLHASSGGWAGSLPTDRDLLPALSHPQLDAMFTRSAQPYRSSPSSRRTARGRSCPLAARSRGGRPRPLLALTGL